MNKIVGIYRFNEKDIDGNDIQAYCYVEEDKNGNIHYHFTDDLSIIRKMFVRYADDNGYKKSDLDSIQDGKHFDLNCTSAQDVFNKIKEANKERPISIQDFIIGFASSPLNPLHIKDEEEELDLSEEDAEDLDEEEDLDDDYDNSLLDPDDAEDFEEDEELDDDGILTDDDFEDKLSVRVRNFFSKAFNYVKEKWNKINPKVRVGFIGIGMAAVTIIATSFAINKFSGPTATGSKVAITDDNENDKDNNKNNDKNNDTKTNNNKNKDTESTDDKDKNEDKEEQNDTKKTTNTTSTSNSSSSNSSSHSSSGSSSNGGSSSSGGTSGGSSSNATKEPGSINDNVPIFQNPDVSLDNSGNNSGNGGSGSSDEQTEDPYENVTEGEQDNNIGEGEEPSQDEDYSEEIDVAPPTEDKDNVDKDDVDFNDELTGNEDSVDDDLSYETDLPLDQSDSEDYEVDYVTPTPLPDPNATAEAGDGDYVTTEDEFNNVTEEEVNTTTPTTESGQSQTEDYSEAIDVVPVTQELVQNEATYTPYGADAVEQAVNEMAEGNDVSLVFNAQTGDVSIQQNTTTNPQTNSMTK